MREWLFLHCNRCMVDVQASSFGHDFWELNGYFILICIHLAHSLLITFIHDDGTNFRVPS